jgi:hypothetical protein
MPKKTKHDCEAFKANNKGALEDALDDDYSEAVAGQQYSPLANPIF